MRGCDLHLYLQFLGILHSHTSSHLAFTYILLRSWMVPGLPFPYALPKVSQHSCLFFLRCTHFYLDFCPFVTPRSQLSAGLKKSYDSVIYLAFFELIGWE